MSYENLLEELGKLNKSMPAATEDTGAEGKDGKDGKKEGATDDAAIAAAAAAGGEGGGGADAGTADDGVDSEVTEMAKALGMKPVKVMIDGKEVEALEGDQLLKGLLLGQKKLGDTQGDSEKVLKSLVSLATQQSKTIKTLTDDIGQMRKSMEALADGGRGRRSAVVVMPPNVDAQKPEDKGMKPGEFMAKALSAQRAGRITGSDIAEAEAFIGRGLNVPESIINRVMAA